MSVYAYANMIANFLFEAVKFLGAVGLILSPVLAALAAIGVSYAVLMGLWTAWDKLTERRPGIAVWVETKARPAALRLAYGLMALIGAALGIGSTAGALGF